MNARIDITAPLEIEITEEEILADLLYPEPPAGARDVPSNAGHRHDRRPGRVDVRANLTRRNGLRRGWAAV